MALDDQLLKRIDGRERRLAELSPGACRASAHLLRDVQPTLTSDRQREIAEEMAEGFEAQAVATSRSPTSP